MNYSFAEVKYKDFLQWILCISLLQGIISSYTGFSKISYLCDIFLIVLVIAKLGVGKLYKVAIKSNVGYLIIIIFWIVVIIGWMFNPAPMAMALWAIRNYGRFYIYYICCNIFQNSEDVIKMENIFIKIFPFHMFVVLYQYIVEKIDHDLLNGIFGNRVGGNTGLILYLSIIVCILMARYAYKKISLTMFVLYLTLILINAALSELKFLFIVVVILFGWYRLMIEGNVREIFVTLLFIVIIYLSIQIFYSVFPEYSNFMNFNNILNQLSAQEVYSSGNDVGRTAVFSKLTPIITSWSGKEAVWVGIGLGNGDYSTAMSFLNSAFFKEYENMHYTWLSLGYLFVETGYLGTVAYTMFFVVLEICAVRKYQKMQSYTNLLGTFFPLICMIMLVYNSVLRSNYAYIIFAALSWNQVKDKVESNV